jgi:phosphate starvation-inducible PhoH-like protein
LILKYTFQPVNNTRLQNLCSDRDEHLRSIEQAFNIKIQHRAEHFRLEGSQSKTQLALAVLQNLYKQADKPIHQSTIQYMLMPQFISDTQTLQEVRWPTSKKSVQALTLSQKGFLDNIHKHDLSFGIGPAGTGKTYLAVGCAVSSLEEGKVERMIFARPAVEAGERLGFLPGDLTQKVDPYLRPIYDALHDLMGYDWVQKAIQRQQVEIAPLAFMRGRTLSHAFIILDEAQNATIEQMKMFLTRIGMGSKMVINGDVSQIDLPKGQASGLIHAENTLKNIQGISFHYFQSHDVVRHPLVTRIVKAYDKTGSI